MNRYSAIKSITLESVLNSQSKDAINSFDLPVEVANLLSAYDNDRGNNPPEPYRFYKVIVFHTDLLTLSETIPDLSAVTSFIKYHVKLISTETTIARCYYRFYSPKNLP